MPTILNQINLTKCALNFKDFDAIEIHPIIEVDGSPDRAETNEEAHYWSVFLHETKGGIIDIADCSTEEIAIQFAELIALIIKKAQTPIKLNY